MPSHHYGDDPFQDLFDSIPETGHFHGQELDYLLDLFDVGFTTHRGEGIGYEERADARQEFFDMLDMDSSEFDWDEWREAMGYND